MILRGCPITTPSSGSSYDSVIVDSDLLMTRYFAPNNFYVTRHRTQTLLRYLPTEITPAGDSHPCELLVSDLSLRSMAPAWNDGARLTDRNHPKKAFNRIRLVSMAQEDLSNYPRVVGTLFCH
jgi:hypothetical protein